MGRGLGCCIFLLSVPSSKSLSGRVQIVKGASGASAEVGVGMDLGLGPGREAESQLWGEGGKG